MKTKAKGKDYTASDIEVLEELEGVRKRPAMYISSTDKFGLFQILKELMDNAADEAMANRNDYAGVCISKDKTTITVWDHGGGIPIEKHPKTGNSTLTDIFTKLHAGGKFGGKAYDKGSKGVHGVGASVTNALSERFQVFTCRKEQWWTQKFSKGKAKSPVEKSVAPKLPNGNKLKRGTLITYQADMSCFKKGSVLDPDYVHKYVELLSYLHSGVTFYFEHDKTSKTYIHKDGLQSLLNRTIKELKVEPISKPLIHQRDNVDVALRWTEYDEEKITSYANGSNTAQHGEHVKGLYAAIVDAIKPFKGKKDFSPQDFRSGLVCIINITIVEPEFSSQTKECLTKESAYKTVYESVKPALDILFRGNKSMVNTLINRAVEMRKLRSEFTANKKTAATIRSTKDRAQLPVKFSASTTRSPEERELFLVEGDSAGGSAKLARDARFQEVLKLRGKVLNAYGPSGQRIFDNKEVLDILRVVGYDASSKNPIAKLRVGKIILLADPDIDGKHITILLLSMFQRLMPGLFKQGKVYVVDAPLFNAAHGSKRFFGATVKEVLDQLPKGARLPEGVQRIKGWGEVKPEVLEQIAFDVKKRKLTQVKAIDGDKLRLFAGIVGENPMARKALLGL